MVEHDTRQKLKFRNSCVWRGATSDLNIFLERGINFKIFDIKIDPIKHKYSRSRSVDILKYF